MSSQGTRLSADGEIKTLDTESAAGGAPARRLNFADTTPVPKQLPALTGLRGAAALWVVVYHLVPLLCRLLKIERVPLFEHGYLGVDVFFVLSGFILCHVYVSAFRQYSTREYTHFLLVRVARVYPLHVVIMLCFALAVWWAPGFATQDGYPRYTFGGFWVGLLLLQNWYKNQLIWNAPAWSLSAEWVAYMVFPWLLMATRWVKSVWLALAGAAGLLVGLAILFIASGHGMQLTGKAGFLRLAAEFTAGGLIRRALGLGAAGRIPWRLVNPLAMVLLVATLLYPASAPAAVPLFGVFVFSLAAQQGLLTRFFSSPAMAFLGEISYSLYLTQSLVMEMGSWYVHRHPEAGTTWTYLAVLSTALLVFPIVTCWAVERPARNAGRRIADRFERRAA